jgi:hypothetical protein
MGIKHECFTTANLGSYILVKAVQVFLGKGAPQFPVRLKPGLIYRLTENILQGHTFIQLLRVPVSFKDKIAVGKYQLGIAQNITEIVEPVGVPIDVPHQPGKLSGKGIGRYLTGNDYPAVSYNHQQPPELLSGHHPFSTGKAS